MYFPDKSQYNGTFSLIKGHFREGKRHGKGLFRNINGVGFEEEWENDELISQKEMNRPVNLDVDCSLT